jgi:glycosyltransferase involved in cell wall biosynthesis
MEAWDRFESTGGGSLELVIAGAGPLASTVAEWASSRSSVEVHGMLSRSDCAALVATARAAIVPSAWEEAFGLVAVEAMACGVPPIAPEHGSFPELIKSDHDGVLFEPGSAPALAGVLHDIDSNPQRYAALGAAARASYEQRFDPEVNLDLLLDTYRFAIAHPVSSAFTASSRSGSAATSG